MKRPGIIAVILFLLLISMPVCAFGGTGVCSLISTAEQGSTVKDHIPLIAGAGGGILLLVIILLVLSGKKRADTVREIDKEAGNEDDTVFPESETSSPVTVQDTKTESTQKMERTEGRPGPSQPAADSAAAVMSPPSPSAPVILRIEEPEGNYTGRETAFAFSRELLVGSDPKQCSIVFSQEGVSPRHARIFRLDEEIYIEDLGSEGGTYLDGMRLFSINLLRDGDEVGIGDCGFIVRIS